MEFIRQPFPRRARRVPIHSLSNETRKREIPVSACSCCGKISFYNDLLEISKFFKSNPDPLFFSQIFGSSRFPSVFLPAVFCRRCITAIRKKKIPLVSIATGFSSRFVPQEVKKLNVLEQRVLAPILPSIQIIRDRRVTQPKVAGDLKTVETDIEGTFDALSSYLIAEGSTPGLWSRVGAVIDVPVDPVATITQQLPRTLQSSGIIALQFVNAAVATSPSPFLAGLVSKEKLLPAMRFLEASPLYERLQLKFNSEQLQPSVFDVEVSSEIPVVVPVTDPQRFSSVSPFEPPYHPTLTEPYRFGETVVLAKNDSQFIPLRQFFQNDRCTVPFSSTFALSTFRDRRQDVYPSELMFPSSFGGQERFPVPSETTLKDILQNELERADFQHQCVFKIFHDYFTYVAHRLVVAKSVFCRQQIGQTAVTAHSNNFFLYEKLLAASRSSPQFWESKRRNLMAMIRQLGIPTFFVTYSPAEIQWPEMIRALLYSEDRRNGRPPRQWSKSEIDVLLTKKAFLTDLLASNPYVALRMTMRRSHLLQKYLIFPATQGAFGRVKDYYFRVEFQMRGSPHIHMVVWVEDALLYNSHLPDSDGLVTDFIDSHITTEFYGLPADQQRQLKVQLHRHSHSCQRGGSCRYRFPIPPTERTVILRSIQRHFFTDEEATLLQRRYEKIVNLMTELQGTDVPMHAFLQRLNLTEDEYYETLRLCYIDKDTVLYRRTVADQWVNKYNADLVFAWEGNVDVTFVLDGYACAAYVVSYITKGFREISATLKEYIRRMKEEDGRCISVKLLSVAAKLVGATQIGIQEAICHLCSVHLSQGSRAVIYVNTQRSAFRLRAVRVQRQQRTVQRDLQDDPSGDSDVENGEAANEDDGLADGLIEHYYDRHTELDTLCFAYYCRFYTFSTKNT